MSKKFIIKVRGEAYEVEVEEVVESGRVERTISTPAPVQATKPVETPVVKTAPVAAPKAESKAAPTANGAQVKAPIPGTIIKNVVKVGDIVKPGQVVIILEAMKLENEIITPAGGEVKQILVSPGASVNEGDVLVVIG